MGAQLAFQRVCAVSGMICALMFFGALLAAGFLPPMSPSMSADAVATFYQDHATGIRAGCGLMLISSMFYVMYTAVISGQMQRIPGVHQTVFNAQLAGGAFASMTFLVPAILFAATAFRPERSAESTQLLNDLSWIFLVIPWPPFMVQCFSFAFAILSDGRPTPLFPRWLGYVNIWGPLSFIPATLPPFFKAGPFAWNGIIVFWLGASIFGLLFIVNTIWLVKAVNSPARAT